MQYNAALIEKLGNTETVAAAARARGVIKREQPGLELVD